MQLGGATRSRAFTRRPRALTTSREMLWRISPARSRRTPPTGFIRPCQRRLVARPPAGSGWLHEVKHDGYRIVARKQGDRVMLWSPHVTNFTDRLPKVAEAVRGLPAEDALIDGEGVVSRPDGLRDFAALRTKAGGAEASLIAFDLFSLKGEDLRQRPLEERRDRLARRRHRSQSPRIPEIKVWKTFQCSNSSAFDALLPQSCRRSSGGHTTANASRWSCSGTSAAWPRFRRSSLRALQASLGLRLMLW